MKAIFMMTQGKYMLHKGWISLISLIKGTDRERLSFIFIYIYKVCDVNNLQHIQQLIWKVKQFIVTVW